MKTITLLIFCLVSVAIADDFKTVDGREYKNVTVRRVEADGIVLTTKSGISKVYFVELPKEVQERFHYDAQKANEELADTQKQQNAQQPVTYVSPVTGDATTYGAITFVQSSPKVPGQLLSVSPVQIV